ncbi:hypothetical protein Hanom_Chr17g01551791 [Helianthus anomalus]
MILIRSTTTAAYLCRRHQQATNASLFLHHSYRCPCLVNWKPHRFFTPVQIATSVVVI